MPKSILYDNSKLAVAKIVKRLRSKVFAELQSHYLFDDRFGRRLSIIAATADGPLVAASAAATSFRNAVLRFASPITNLASFSEPSLMSAHSTLAGAPFFILLDLGGSTLGAIARRACWSIL